MDTVQKLAKTWLVIGWMMLLGGAVGLLGLAIVEPTPAELREKTENLTVSTFNVVIGSTVAVASIGLLRRRTWSRWLLELACWILLLACSAFSLMWFGLLPSSLPRLQPWQTAVMGSISAAIAAGIVYSLVLLRSKKVRNAICQQSPDGQVVDRPKDS